MSVTVARALIAIAAAILGDRGRDWARAMAAELEAAVEAGRPLRFATGCLVAAVREVPRHDEGRMGLAAHALAIGIMIPMAVAQIGSALFGLPYLFPDQKGLEGAVIVGVDHLDLARSIYLAALPSLCMLLLLLGAGHLRLAWAMLDGDWARASRYGRVALAATVTLVLLMNVLFLNSIQALMMGLILLIELSTVLLIARRYAEIEASARSSAPG